MPASASQKTSILHLLERGALDGAGSQLAALQASDPGDAEVWTLTSNLHLLRGDAPGAERALWTAYGLAPERFEPRLLLADILRKQGRLREARYWYARAAEIAGDDPDYRPFVTDGLRALAGAARGGTLKVAIVCGPDRAFIRPIERSLRERHEVRTAYFDGSADLAGVQTLLDWADVAWFEWCDPLFVAASQKLRKSCPVVCRLHSYEAFTEMPSRVNWSFVDHVVFVGPHLERIFLDQAQRFEGPLPTTSVVSNGVDLERYAFRERARSFDVAYVGYINYKKNPEMLLQVLAALVRRDPRYRLHVAGRFQDLRYALYFEKMVRELSLQDNFVFCGWVEDVERWLEDKTYLLSTSVLESFGMSIAEGMARGLKPVVHNWVGAEEIYPRSVLFNTIDEAVEMIVDGDVASHGYRRYIEQHYSADRQFDAVERLLETLDARKHAAAQDAGPEGPPFPPGALKRMVAGLSAA